MWKLAFLRLENQADTPLRRSIFASVVVSIAEGSACVPKRRENNLSMYQSLFSQSFVFIGKLMRDLKYLIQCFLRMNHPVFSKNKTVYPLGLSEDQFIVFTFILMITAVRLCLSKTKFTLVTLNLQLLNCKSPLKLLLRATYESYSSLYFWRPALYFMFETDIYEASGHVTGS
jgi:hypothetical protein